MRVLVMCLLLAACGREPLPGATPDLAPGCGFETFVDCGCGCCGGIEPQTVCVHRSKGETLESVRGNPPQPTPAQCANAGCSSGIQYVCCD